MSNKTAGFFSRVVMNNTSRQFSDAVSGQIVSGVLDYVHNTHRLSEKINAIVDEWIETQLAKETPERIAQDPEVRREKLASLFEWLDVRDWMWKGTAAYEGSSELRWDFKLLRRDIEEAINRELRHQGIKGLYWHHMYRLTENWRERLIFTHRYDSDRLPAGATVPELVFDLAASAAVDKKGAYKYGGPKQRITVQSLSDESDMVSKELVMWAMTVYEAVRVGRFQSKQSIEEGGSDE